MSSSRNNAHVRRTLAQCLSGAVAIASVTTAGFLLGIDLATAACIYMIVIVLVSLQGSFLSSTIVSLTAIGCLAYYFAPPIYSFQVGDTVHGVAVIAFFTTSAVITRLVSRVRTSKEQEFNMRLEERVGERTRIARELHDTLLRSFQGLISGFRSADDLLPSRPAEAKRILEQTLDEAAQTIADAQDAVHELRSSTVITYDLASAITSLGTALAVHHTIDSAGADLPTFLVEVEGTPHDLHPILRDEIYRIAGQALRNAFQTNAHRIRVEIRYDQWQLEVTVQDDGKAATKQGVPDYAGLDGMRERANTINALLEFRTTPERGTEVELQVPASVAYQPHNEQPFRVFSSSPK